MAQTDTSASSHHSTLSRRAREQVESDSEQLAERHVHDSSSVAPARADQPGVLLRSPVMWGLLYLPALTLITVLGYMVHHLHSGPGRVPGVGDLGSANAQPGDK
jgi:hypothetical protein